MFFLFLLFNFFFSLKPPSGSDKAWHSEPHRLSSVHTVAAAAGKFNHLCLPACTSFISAWHRLATATAAAVIFTGFPSRDPRPRRQCSRRVETRPKPIFNQVAAVAFEHCVNKTNQKVEQMTERSFLFFLRIQRKVQKTDCVTLLDLNFWIDSHNTHKHEPPCLCFIQSLKSCLCPKDTHTWQTAKLVGRK